MTKDLRIKRLQYTVKAICLDPQISEEALVLLETAVRNAESKLHAEKMKLL